MSPTSRRPDLGRRGTRVGDHRRSSIGKRGVKSGYVSVEVYRGERLARTRSRTNDKVGRMKRRESRGWEEGRETYCREEEVRRVGLKQRISERYKEEKRKLKGRKKNDSSRRDQDLAYSRTLNPVLVRSKILESPSSMTCLISSSFK